MACVVVASASTRCCVVLLELKIVLAAGSPTPLQGGGGSEFPILSCVSAKVARFSTAVRQLSPTEKVLHSLYAGMRCGNARLVDVEKEMRGYEQRGASTSLRAFRPAVLAVKCCLSV